MAPTTITRLWAEAKIKVRLELREDDPRSLAGYDLWASGTAEINVGGCDKQGGKEIRISAPIRILAGHFAKVPDAARPAAVYDQLVHMDRDLDPFLSLRWQVNPKPVEDYDLDAFEAVAVEVDGRISDEELFELCGTPEEDRSEERLKELRQELREAVKEALCRARIDGADEHDYLTALREWIEREEPVLSWIFSMLSPDGMLFHSVLREAAATARYLSALNDPSKVARGIFKRAADEVNSKISRIDFTTSELFQSYRRLVEVRTWRGNAAFLPVQAVLHSPVRLNDGDREKVRLRVASLYQITLDSAASLIEAHQEAVDHCNAIEESLRAFRNAMTSGKSLEALLAFARFYKMVTDYCPAAGEKVRLTLRTF